MSVLELVKLFEQTTGVTIPIIWTGRRAGDVDKVVCDAQLAYRELGWKAKYDAARMCNRITKYYLFYSFPLLKLFHILFR